MMLFVFRITNIEISKVKSNSLQIYFLQNNWNEKEPTNI